MNFILITKVKGEPYVVTELRLLSPSMIILFSNASTIDGGLSSILDLDMVLPIESLINIDSHWKKLIKAIRLAIGETLRTTIYSLHYKELYYCKNGVSKQYGDPERVITI